MKKKLTIKWTVKDSIVYMQILEQEGLPSTYLSDNVNIQGVPEISTNGAIYLRGYETEMDLNVCSYYQSGYDPFEWIKNKMDQIITEFFASPEPNKGDVVEYEDYNGTSYHGELVEIFKVPNRLDNGKSAVAVIKTGKQVPYYEVATNIISNPNLLVNKTVEELSDKTIITYQIEGK